MITNNPVTVGDRTTDLIRNAFEHRATWLYLLYESAKKRGLDDEFAREAIYKCGCIQGARLPDTIKTPHDFGKAFAVPEVTKAFDIETIYADDGAFALHFSYCPLVAAWQKLTDDEELIALMCDVAMDGDKGIGSNFDFEVTLGPRIAYGDDHCEVWFRQKK